jgi:GT2 family glycosyltransferase
MALGREPLIDVLVVNYNAGRYLDECLAGLISQSFREFRAIVADNGSTDDSFARCMKTIADPRFRFVSFARNIGFAAANSRAAALGKAPWIVTLNPDAVPEPDWLAALADAAARHPDVDMFGSTQVDFADPSKLDGVGDAYLAIGLPWRGGFGHPRSETPPEAEVFGPCAAAAMYRRAGFEALGGFDERFFCYVEDVDLAFRWRLAGGRCIQLPTAVVHHVGGVSSGGDGSAFARYHGTRNLVWTFVKNMPAPLFWPLLPAHAAALVFLLLKAVARGQGAAVARGLRDALSGIGAIWLERNRIQRARAVSSATMARAVTWSPRLYFRRAPAPLRCTRAGDGQHAPFAR